MTAQVEALRQKNPVNYVSKNASKRLATINKLMYALIPQDPARS
ncbi:type II toxin-antitoxin system YhaV family toxin [Undibacterium sp. Ji50W]